MNKRLVVALAVVSISATATVAFAGFGPGTGINGSYHDLNAVAGYTGDTLGRSCVFCHTPHNAITGANGHGSAKDIESPLWNHADNVLANLQAYQWVAPTNKAIGAITDPLYGPSRLCMACHDGSTAVDSHGSARSTPTGSTLMKTVATANLTDALGNPQHRYITDLQTTHPIGFSYQTAMEKRNTGRIPEIINKNQGFIDYDIPANWDTVNRPTDGTLTSKRIQDTLYGGDIMTCASCHEVHNVLNAKPSSGHEYNYFLYAKEEGSAICLSCHVK